MNKIVGIKKITMNDYNENSNYLRAKSKVDKVRGFYIHFAVYIIVNIGITVFKITRNLNNGETFNEAFFDFSTFALWMLWGIGLALHAFSVYGIDYILGENWEEKRIQKYMEDDKNYKQY